jgi:hypothetical protein
MNHNEAHGHAADPHATVICRARKPSRHARHSVILFCCLFVSTTPLQEDKARARYGLATSLPITNLSREKEPAPRRAIARSTTIMRKSVLPSFMAAQKPFGELKLQ